MIAVFGYAAQVIMPSSRALLLRDMVFAPTCVPHYMPCPAREGHKSYAAVLCLP